MSYSAFFTAGLTLASHPRDYEYSFSNLPPLQINLHPGTPRRTRKRRSSLTLTILPIGSIKSPVRTANDVARGALRTVSPRSPRDGHFEALHHGTRPRYAAFFLCLIANQAHICQTQSIEYPQGSSVSPCSHFPAAHHSQPLQRSVSRYPCVANAYNTHRRRISISHNYNHRLASSCIPSRITPFQSCP